MSLIGDSRICNVCGGYELYGMSQQLRTLSSACKCPDPIEAYIEERDAGLTEKVERELRATMKMQRRAAA